MYTPACVDILYIPRAMRRLRRFAALALAAVVFLASTGWAAADASHDLAHAAAGTESPLPSEHGKAPGHSCATHLTAHLFAPLESKASAVQLTRADLVQPILSVSHATSIADGLFRPPRALLQA